VNKTKFSKKQINDVIKEFSKRCMHGTDKPVVLDERGAFLILRSRKHLDDYLKSVHPSHDMTDWYSEIKCPCNTERFYKTRKCKKCEGEQYYHPAGRFIDPELEKPCVE